MTADYPEQRPLRAFALIFLASLSFASLSAAIKAVAPITGLAPPIAARGLVGFLICLAWARSRQQPLRPKNTGMLAVRCLTGAAAMLSYYWALTPAARTDLPTAVMLLKTAPLWVALLSPLVVAERPGRRLWLALAIGLVGVGIRYGWSLQGEQLGVFASLAAGLFAGLAYLSLRALARTDDPLVVVLWFSAFLTLAPLPFLGPALDAGAAWTARTWGLLALCGLLGTCGQLFLTAAYRYGTATAVTIGGLVEVGIAMGYSFLLFQERPALAAIVGGLLAMSAGFVANSGRSGAQEVTPQEPGTPST